MGTPVFLTSNIGAMAEVAGGACELVDPSDIGAICAGLNQLTSNAFRRDELRRLGLHRAAEFSWATAAQRTLVAYEQAVAEMT